MKIFISGGSGLGKTTLAHKICSSYNIKYEGSIVRSTIEKDPEFFNRDFSYRQLLLMNKSLDFHYSDKDRILNDRSYFDYYVWTKKVLGKELAPIPECLFNNSDIVIIAPTPNLDWYKDHIDIFWEDEPRRKSYGELGKVTISTKIDFAQVLFDVTSELESEIKSLVYANIPDLNNMIHIKPSNDNYYYWADKSFEEVGAKLK